MNLSTPHSFESPNPDEVVCDEPLVLLAEDDVELRRLLSESLAEDGFLVRTASNGRELLSMLSAVCRGEMPMPSLIVSDVRMPNCSGMDVLAALRLADWEVPVVLITGFGDDELHATAGTVGATIVLDKPFELDTLRSVVRALCPSPTAVFERRTLEEDVDDTRVSDARAKGLHS